MDRLTDPQIWAGLLTLTALEVVLGIDNLVLSPSSSPSCGPASGAGAQTRGRLALGHGWACWPRSLDHPSDRAVFASPGTASPGAT